MDSWEKLLSQPRWRRGDTRLKYRAFVRKFCSVQNLMWGNFRRVFQDDTTPSKACFPVSYTKVGGRPLHRHKKRSTGIPWVCVYPFRTCRCCVYGKSRNIFAAGKSWGLNGKGRCFGDSRTIVLWNQHEVTEQPQTLSSLPVCFNIQSRYMVFIHILR